MLNDVLNIAATGLAAASAAMATTADNIANANTPGYRARRTDLVELSTGGVAVAGTSTDNSPSDPSTSNVDLAAESVDLIRERTLYAANAMVVRTANGMMGSLLDMFDTDHGYRGR